MFKEFSQPALEFQRLLQESLKNKTWKGLRGKQQSCLMNLAIFWVFSVGLWGNFSRQNVSQIMHILLQKFMIRTMNTAMLRISTLQAIFHLHSQIYAENKLILSFSFFLSYHIEALLYQYFFREGIVLIFIFFSPSAMKINYKGNIVVFVVNHFSFFTFLSRWPGNER